MSSSQPGLTPARLQSLGPVGNASAGYAASSVRPTSPKENWARARKAVLARVAETRAEAPIKGRSAWDVSYVKLKRPRPAVKTNDAHRFVAQVAAVRQHAAPHVPSQPPSHLAALQRLGGTLEQFRHLGALPNPTIVLAELSVPFLDRTVDLEACNFALNLFSTMRLYYRAISSNEELARCMWCCQAAAASDSGQLRRRAIAQLTDLVFPPVGSASVPMSDTSLALQTFAVGLLKVAYAITTSADPDRDKVRSEYRSIMEMCARLAAGDIVKVNESDEYAAGSQRLEAAAVARVAYLEGVVRVIAGGPRGLSTFVLVEVLKDAWLPWQSVPLDILLRMLRQLNVSFTDLFAPAIDIKDAIVIRKDDQALIAAILQFLNAHLHPRLVRMMSSDMQQAAIACYLPLLSNLSIDQYTNQDWPARPQLEMPTHIADLRGALEDIWNAGMTSALIAAASDAVKKLFEKQLAAIGFLCLALKPDMANLCAKACIPALQKKLLELQNQGKLQNRVSELLVALSKQHAQIFYKPLFTCVASNKANTVQDQLRILRASAQYVTPLRFYFSDAEMMAVALLSRSNTAAVGPSKVWSSLRLGQQAILAELTSALRSYRTQTMMVSQVREIREFADDFEPKLERSLVLRESESLLAVRDRMLVASLLLELHLIAMGQRKPPWFDRVVKWTSSAHVGAPLFLAAESPSNPFLQKVQPALILSSEDEAGALTSLEHLGDILAAADSELPAGNGHLSGLMTELRSGGIAAPLLNLIAALHPGLSDDDLEMLCRKIWSYHMLKHSRFETIPSTFLFMQGCDRLPQAMMSLVDKDLTSLDPRLRMSVVVKLSNLFVHRFDLLALALPDKLRRRPFRTPRQQVDFVPTNMGASTYTAAPSIESSRMDIAASLPPEIRKALVDLGWDEKSSNESDGVRLRTPLHLVPAAHACVREEAGAPSGRTAGALIRRKSSTSSMTGKTVRPVLVVAAAALLCRLVFLVTDEDAQIASTATEAMVLFMRDDPLLLCRPLLEDLSGTPEQQSRATQVIHRMLLLDTDLSPAFVHHVFNNLAGYVRHRGRLEEHTGAQSDMLRAMPAMCRLGALVSDMSIREIRKNKSEAMLIPTGDLWFTDSSLEGDNFPKPHSVDDLPFQRIDVPSAMFAAVALRIAQNGFIADLLGRRRDSEIFWRVKQTLRPLALPLSDAPKALSDSDFLPCREPSVLSLERITRRHQDLRTLSRLLVKSHLHMTFALLSASSRHFSDRTELAKLFDGVCRALLTHGAVDADIALMAIKCCLLASLRFHRLFSSGNGFSVFVPALFKTYCDTHVASVKGAIAYAWIAFYSRHEHQESFVFQTLSSLASIIATPDVPSTLIDVARTHLFELLVCLAKGTAGSVDPLVVALEAEEKEARIDRLNDAPESVLAPLLKRQVDSAGTTRIKATFSLEDSVRLCITAITYEPTSKRALNFVRLFRLLIPAFLKHGGPAAKLAGEGVEALSAVFAKPVPPVRIKPLSGIVTDIPAAPDASQQLAWASSREAYLFLCESFLSAGGEMSPHGIHQVLEFLKGILRSVGPSAHTAASTIVRKFADSLFAREANSRRAFGFLREFAPVFAEFVRSVGFAPFMEGLNRLTKQFGTQGNEQISTLLTTEYVVPAIAAIMGISVPTPNMTSLRTATVQLIASIGLHDFDEVLAPLEAQEASSTLLVRIVLPLLTQLRLAEYETTLNYDNYAHRGRLYQRLATLVGAIMISKRSTAVCLLGCQALKILAIGAERALSSVVGSWSYLSSVFRTLLSSGGLQFLDDLGPSIPTPLASTGRHGHSLSYGAHQGSLSPSASDYAFWSLAEMLVLTSSPLMIHLRSMLREKLVQGRERNISASGFDSRKGSIPASSAPSPGPNFKRHLTHSQRTSPRAVKTPSTPHERTYVPVGPSSAGSPPAEPSFPRIQHLGLAPLQTDRVMSSDDQAIRSQILTKHTLRRIRKVQILLGEVPITHSLAMPREGADEEEGLHAWSRHETLKRLGDETALILAELETTT